LRSYRGRSSKPLAVLVALAGMLAVCAAPAAAQTGGMDPGTTTTTPTTPTTPVSATPGRATLLPDGSAVAPPDAPIAVQKAIAAANKIRLKPYIYGGGHRSWKAKGYDCSGAVSFVLRGAGLLKKRPMTSGTLARSWGQPGVGQWITVYGNRSHAYMVVAGLRFDTSAVGESFTSGSGPRWRATQRSSSGYTAKYWPGY
jgi:hypothetical protein